MFKILATIALLNTTNAQITADNTWTKTACDDAIVVYSCAALKTADTTGETLDCEADAATKVGQTVTVTAAVADASADDTQENDGFYTFEEY